MIRLHRSPGQGPSGPLGRLDSSATMELNAVGLDTPMRHFGSYAVVLFETGWCRYRDEWARSHRLVGGDVVIVLPRFGHRYDADPASPVQPQHTYVVFDGPMPELWERVGWLGPDHALLPGALDPRDGRRLLELLHGDDAIEEMLRLQRLLHELLRGRREIPPQDAWLERAQRLLADNLDQPADLPAIAEAMNLSYPAFRRRFKQAAGVSPGRFRAERVVAQATQLMATTDMSDKQIAHQLGFANPYHFSRRFKQLTHETPTAYRKRYTRPDAMPKPPPPMPG